MSGRDDAAQSARPDTWPLDDEETMSKPNTERAAPAAPTNAEAPERRQNARLRVLVDEMLLSIRESQRRDDWTDEERERAEADLDRIMAQVRRAATHQDR